MPAGHLEAALSSPTYLWWYVHGVDSDAVLNLATHMLSCMMRRYDLWVRVYRWTNVWNVVPM